MKTRKLMILIIAVLLFTGCHDPDRDQTFESPFGNDEVVVMVDYLSCPDVFYDGECIFEYDGPGFNETVYWDVEWISERKPDTQLISPIFSSCSFAQDHYLGISM